MQSTWAMLPSVKRYQGILALGFEPIYGCDLEPNTPHALQIPDELWVMESRRWHQPRKLAHKTAVPLLPIYRFGTKALLATWQ